MTNSEWKARQINDGAAPWSVIDPNGAHGDTIIAGYIKSEEHARLVTRLFNLYLAGKAMVGRQNDNIINQGGIPPDHDWGLTENESAAAQMMNGLWEQNEKMVALLEELIDIEGPQPGTGEWAGKVQKLLAEVRGES